MGHLARAVVALLIRRVLLVANPASRMGDQLRERAVRAFSELGIACDVTLTERTGHAYELAAGGASGGAYDALFTLGGDGTAMEAAGALAGGSMPLGVLAAGTGNLLARAIGIPLDIRRAVRALVRGDIRWIDLGRLDNGRRFAVAAGFGIDASMVAETPRWLKRRLGVLAYALTATRAALRAVLLGDMFLARVTVDGRTVERRVAAVMIANFGAILDERLTFGPGISCDDGLLDACLYSPRSLLDAFRIMWRLLRKNFTSDEITMYMSGTAIDVETTPARMSQADGELLGEGPLHVVVEARTLALLVPAR
ncbi:MAG: hypothetical protein JWO05_671 [Gemmatimonadetes bacterium]|nr:hypothetical protein [Gemmatimonadota bacterium]